MLGFVHKILLMSAIVKSYLELKMLKKICIKLRNKKKVRLYTGKPIKVWLFTQCGSEGTHEKTTRNRPIPIVLFCISLFLF